MKKRWRKVSQYSPRGGVLTEVYFDGISLYAYLTKAETFEDYIVSLRVGNKWVGNTSGRTKRGALAAATRFYSKVIELNKKYAVAKG